MEMDATPSNSETTTLTDTIEISSNINVHPIMAQDQSLLQLVKEIHSFTESLTGATQLYISSDQTHMSIDDDSALT
jgi:hypothetical protein